MLLNLVKFALAILSADGYSFNTSRMYLQNTSLHMLLNSGNTKSKWLTIAFFNLTLSLFKEDLYPVSYTHLTLPTNREV